MASSHRFGHPPCSPLTEAAICSTGSSGKAGLLERECARVRFRDSVGERRESSEESLESTSVERGLRTQRVKVSGEDSRNETKLH